MRNNFISMRHHCITDTDTHKKKEKTSLIAGNINEEPRIHAEDSINLTKFACAILNFQSDNNFEGQEVVKCALTKGTAISHKRILLHLPATDPRT